jgi:nucleotide-binding universal stress UspA family protein
LVKEVGIDMVVTSTRGGSGVRHWLTGGVASQIVQSISEPVFLVQSDSQDDGRHPQIRRILVALDGSKVAERVLPYALTFARAFQSAVLLLSVPEIPEATKFGAVVDWVETMRIEAEIEAWKYLDSILATVHDDCPDIRTLVTGSRPATAIVDVAAAEGADLIMLATHGRGGLDRLWMGSVAERVVQQTQLPIFLLPTHSKEAVQPVQPERVAAKAMGG